MPQSFDEENLRFEFSDEWQVIRLDRHEFFKKRLMPLQFTKAVDFVGLYKNRDLYLIEVKDYRGRPIELKNAEKESVGGPLHLNVARKVKDSLLCIVAAARGLPQDPFWESCAQAVRNRQRPIRVVFWLEFDVAFARGRRSSKYVAQQLRLQADVRRERCKQALTWITREIEVTNQQIGGDVLVGVTVTNIARVRP